MHLINGRVRVEVTEFDSGVAIADTASEFWYIAENSELETYKEQVETMPGSATGAEVIGTPDAINGNLVLGSPIALVDLATSNDTYDYEGLFSTEVRNGPQSDLDLYNLYFLISDNTDAVEIEITGSYITDVNEPDFTITMPVDII